MGWRPPPGVAPVVPEGGDPADPDLRAWPKTCAFTASPELWRALRVRARAENISVTALIRRTLQREFLPPRKREPEPPLNEADDAGGLPPASSASCRALPFPPPSLLRKATDMADPTFTISSPIPDSTDDALRWRLPPRAAEKFIAIRDAADAAAVS